MNRKVPTTKNQDEHQKQNEELDENKGEQEEEKGLTLKEPEERVKITRERRE